MNKGLIKLSDLNHVNANILKVLDNEAPIRVKYARANEAPYTNRDLKKDTIKRSRLFKTTLQMKTTWFIKNRNLCVTLLRKEMKNEIFLKILTPKKYH